MEKEEREESLLLKSLRITAIVVVYWFISISFVFLNKHLLSGLETRLDAPCFITWYQCVVSLVILFLMSLFADKVPCLKGFPSFKVDLMICMKLLPLSAVFVGMIMFNSLGLKNINVAFYHVARSLSSVWNVIFSYWLLNLKTSARALACCAVLISGYLLGVNQEGSAGDIAFAGVFFGLMGSIFVCLNAIFTKKYLPVIDQDIWKLQLYNNINAFVLFIPVIFIMGEVGEVISYPDLGSSHFWGLMTLGGVFGISIGYVSGLQIKFTTPLTHNISGCAKACLQTVIAVFVNNEIKTVLWWVSNVMVIIGSGLYTYVRHEEMRADHVKQAATVVAVPIEEKPIIQEEA